MLHWRWMKFGVLQFFSWPERRVPIEIVFQRALDRIRIMEQNAYETVWLAEHHFVGYSVCPSVTMMGVHVANHTRRLRIGTAVTLASFYHPLRLAEELAMLDVLSDGRLDWGAGRGFDPVEFEIFRVPVEESGRRFHEAVEIVQAAWRDDRLTWEGEFWRFRDVEVLPKPKQRPHPRIWLAAGSPGAVTWAGKRGYSIMLGAHSTFSENRAHYELYQQQLAAHGHPSDGRITPMSRLVAVAETDEEAMAVARGGSAWLVGSYMNPSKATRPDSPDQLILTLSREQKMQRYLDEVVIHGSPARVADQIQRLREEMRLEYLMMAPLSHQSFMLFTEEVLPRLT